VSGGRGHRWSRGAKKFLGGSYPLYFPRLCFGDILYLVARAVAGPEPRGIASHEK